MPPRPLPDVRVDGVRTLAPVRGAFAFDLAGVRWSGPAGRHARGARTRRRRLVAVDAPGADRPRPGAARPRRALVGARLAARLERAAGAPARPRPRARAARRSRQRAQRAGARAPRALRPSPTRRSSPPAPRGAPTSASCAASPDIASALKLRLRAPHGQRERLQQGAGAGHRALDPDVPHALAGLEGHRLQLPRRRLRPDLRGPGRRHRGERRRRPGRGLQHRHGGHRGDRQRRDRRADGRRRARR